MYNVEKSTFEKLNESLSKFEDFQQPEISTSLIKQVAEIVGEEVRILPG